jgi:hypothetical protein
LTTAFLLITPFGMKQVRFQIPVDSKKSAIAFCNHHFITLIWVFCLPFPIDTFLMSCQQDTCQQVQQT